MLYIYFRNGKEREVEVLSSFKPGSWIHVEDPSVREIDFLVTTFSLDQKLLNDAIDIYEVPRIEQEGDVTYIFARFARSEDQQILTAPILIAIGKNFLVSISRKTFSRMEVLLGNKTHIQTVQKNKLLIEILYQIQHTYNENLNMLGKRIGSISVYMEKIKNKDVIQFVSYENVLNDFSQALVRESKNLNNLLSEKYIVLTKTEKDLIEELALNNAQLVQICSENLRTIINVREAYSTIMTNNLNRVIKLFTSFTVILTIPTIISSFFGMNVSLPNAESPVAFYQIVTLTAIICVTTLIIFIWKDWL